METKICKDCNKKKSLLCFNKYVDSKGYTYQQGYCKDCKRARQNNYLKTPQGKEVSRRSRKKSNTKAISTLSDLYIKRLISNNRSYKGLPSSITIITAKEIKKWREALIIKRIMIESHKVDGIRVCTICGDIYKSSKKQPRCTACHTAQVYKWRATKPEYGKEVYTRYVNTHKNNLTDSHIRTLLRKTLNQNDGLDLTNKDISQSLVELKRKELLLNNKLKIK